MDFSQLIDNFIVFDDKEEGFISWIPKEGYVLMVRGEDGVWYHAHYFQRVTEGHGSDDRIIIQLEGLPEEPYNGSFLDPVPVRVYKRIS